MHMNHRIMFQRNKFRKLICLTEKSSLLLFFLFIFSYNLSTRLMAGIGGPDKFGYTWKDSYEADGPVYKWFEIPANTDRVVNGLGDDNVMGPFPIGGKFIFYWYPVDKFWVGSNGYITFNDINIAAPFPSIPDSTTQKYNFIAPMMSDLIFVGKGNQARCLYHITEDSLIVSYLNVPFWSSSPLSYNQTGLNTFQIILNRLDNSITFNYQLQKGTTGSNYTIGIENMSGTMGLQYTKSTYPKQGYSIKFYYPQNPSYKITDGGIKWNTKDGSRGIFIPYPCNNFQLSADIANLGNQNIPSYSVTGDIIDPSGNTILSSTLNVNKMLYASYDTLITLPDKFYPATTGSHSYVTTLSGIDNDKFSSDDNITQEIVVIDTSHTVMNLSYATGTPTGNLSWIGGNAGAAVYFSPPAYPVQIVSTNFIISRNPNYDSFIAKIYDDKGLNGMPGNLLDSVVINPDQIVVGAKTQVPTSKDLLINSGGVYVVWVMNGDSIGLGLDHNPPFSGQTYEDLNGTFAQYRDSQDQDFFIDLNIKKHTIEDIGVSSIKSPENNAVIKKPTIVSCWIKNYGQTPLSTFNVYYSMDYGQQIIESYSGNNLNPGDSILFNFSKPLYTSLDSIVGNLCTGTILLNDYNHTNDSQCNYIKIFNTDGIEEFRNINSELLITPNPFSESTLIKFNNQNKSLFNISIYNMMGKEIKVINNITSDYVTINRENLIPGIYFISLKSSKKSLNAKLIISN